MIGAQRAALYEERAEQRKPQRYDGGCFAGGYATQSAAFIAGRRMLSGYQLYSIISFCTTCKSYHVIANAAKITLPDNWQLILQRVAQGFNDREIAGELNITARKVKWVVEKISRRLYALSRTHLIALALEFGLIERVGLEPLSEKCIAAANV